MSQALILVDIQNDFLPGGALAVPNGDEIVPIVNRIQPRFDLIVATQDWHPADHASFAANHAGKQIGDIIKLGECDQILWPTHCVQDTNGAAFAQELDQERIHQVFPKGTDPNIDSYSGFFDNDHRRGTGLAEYLRQREITDVFVCGLATDYCVKFTALDACQLGLKTHVLQDACRAVNLNPNDEAAAIAELRSRGVEIITSGFSQE